MEKNKQLENRLRAKRAKEHTNFITEENSRPFIEHVTGGLEEKAAKFVINEARQSKIEEILARLDAEARRKYKRTRMSNLDKPKAYRRNTDQPESSYGGSK